MTKPPPATARAPRRHLLASLASLPLGLAAAACGTIVPGQTPPPNLYRLTPKSTFASDLPEAAWQLVLEQPITDASLNTSRVALMRSPVQLDYYARTSWIDRAPLMVLKLMIESFENSRRIVAVGRESVGLRADFVLKTELREFQAEYLGSEIPSVRVAINAKLVRMPRRDIVASHSWERRITAKADRVDDVILAFDEALGKTLRRLVEWTLRQGHKAAG